jgi:hypothetical protein
MKAKTQLIVLITTILALAFLVLGIVGVYNIYLNIIGVEGGTPDALIIGSAVFFSFTLILLVISRRQLRTGRKWSKVVAVARSHEEISLEDMSKQSGVAIDEVDDLVYDAISSKHLKGTVKDGRFVRSTPTQTVAATPSTPTQEKIVTEKVFVICPFCGAKTEQGLAKCQKCNADL